jgi:hypothetical protein
MSENSIVVADSQVLVTDDDEDGEAFTTDFDTVALDFDVMSVLKNRRIKGDFKWLQYYNALERYLYKKDPSFKPPQFKFDVHEDVSGNLTFSLRRSNTAFKYFKYLPAIIGPFIGAAFNALLR